MISCRATLRSEYNGALAYDAAMGLARSDHDRLDERSLALHGLIARKVLADPALLEAVRDTVRRWLEMDGSPRLALTEWERILSGPAEQVAQLLTERSERANRLRQSSPFCGILSESERRVVYESYSARAHHPGRQPDLR